MLELFETTLVAHLGRPAAVPPAGRAGMSRTWTIDAARARDLTEQLRTAIEDVRAAVLVLARRVRAAHQARVWTVLEYPSWSAYALAEFGIGRSTAYRLLDLAAVAEAIEDPGRHHRRGLAPPRLCQPRRHHPAARRPARHRCARLEVVPAYVSDRQAEDRGLARLASDIGITTEEILACRRYAISGDVRAMDGW
ncbi:hypothetical protein [Kitasatospora sp. NPDC050463]|uniref:hypothetical protein n=1 Tax=Kitasatospora sp. NPDC050463 TaxID=3155786 RepID=UPI0033CD2631